MKTFVILMALISGFTVATEAKNDPVCGDAAVAALVYSFGNEPSLQTLASRLDDFAIAASRGAYLTFREMRDAGEVCLNRSFFDAQRKKIKAEADRKEKPDLEKKRKADADKKAKAETKHKAVEETNAHSQATPVDSRGEVDKYAALIKATVERYMILEPTMRGKTCTLGVKLASSGMVISVDSGQGDLAVCRSGKAAILKANQLPVPKDPAALEMLKEFNLKLEPNI
ncbi:cell envelope integrity inner membrane protein TolA [compost metagenome]